MNIEITTFIGIGVALLSIQVLIRFNTGLVDPT